MVNLGNFFGARGRQANPSSDRQRGMACKAQGLVLDKATKQCRASRRGAGLASARTARAMNRALAGPTQKDMAAACKAQGLVFDRATKQCRSSKRGLSGLERAYARGSVFFGQRGRQANPMSDRQLAMACKAQGLVLDKATKQCRASQRGAGLASARTARAMNRVMAGPTQKEMAAACKAQGLVFDRATKQCRPSKRGLSGLERAYARGSVFFGVDATTNAQVPARVYANPANMSPASVTGRMPAIVKGISDLLSMSRQLSPEQLKAAGLSGPIMVPVTRDASAAVAKNVNKFGMTKMKNKKRNKFGPTQLGSLVVYEPDPNRYGELMPAGKIALNVNMKNLTN